jgi:hypothetical protein
MLVEILADGTSHRDVQLVEWAFATDVVEFIGRAVK